VATDIADKVLQKSFQLQQSVDNACDWLAQQTGLPKGRIKLAMGNGAVQVRKPPGSKWQRLRRASTRLPAGSGLKIFYNPKLLAIKPALPQLIHDYGRYSIWFKPPGVMTQGNEWGDHCSLLRLVELHFNNTRQVFPVHRLDQDACGLVLVAHDKKSAALLSELFVSRNISKQYRVRVEGQWDSSLTLIDSPVDGKSALTKIENFESGEETSLLIVTIETGRKHQIRQHLSQNGHAVVGDALYGVKNSQTLHLAATKLSYQCPVRGRFVSHELSPEFIAPYWQ